MAAPICDNTHVFLLKRLGVPSSCRRSEDPRFVEILTPYELSTYISRHPGCCLFETLRDEEDCSVVRVFADIDMEGAMEEEDFVAALEDLIVETAAFFDRFAAEFCGTAQGEVKRAMLSNFTVTRSTAEHKTSFHLIFTDAYTTMDTLVAAKRSLLDLCRRSDNVLLRALDTAVYRRGATLRVVGTRKTPDAAAVHRMQSPDDDIKNYLFTYVELLDTSVYFELSDREQHSLSTVSWETSYIPFNDAMRRVCQAVVNDIVNIRDITEDNFLDTPLVIDYATRCALCKKPKHKHAHHITMGNGCLRLVKGGNAHSCKVKVIQLEGNKLFTAAQIIVASEVVKLTERGDYIVWLNNSWRFSVDESPITKLILDVRHSLPADYANEMLCPRKRKVVETNIRDMLVEVSETDTLYDKLPFTNGVLDLATGEFLSGDRAKACVCTVSTGYRFSQEDYDAAADSEAARHLARVIDDIQPQTPANAENRALYERAMSSALCGATKSVIVFFYGDTMTGKSTSKRLLMSALGGLFIETGQTVLTDVLDKGPNPFVANMHLRRAVFCSELPDFACHGARKLRSDNFKKLTEPCIVGRPCFSNRIHNRNHATFIIDTNYRPVFDRVDNALMRRVALVRFRTHFSSAATRAAAAHNVEYNAVKDMDDGLDTKIQRNHFRYAFLRLLVQWFRKYHVPQVVLDATPDAVPDFAFHRRIAELVVPSNEAHKLRIEALSKLGYVLANGTVAMPTSVFQQRLATHFNARIHGGDIDAFITKHKKVVNVTEEYVEYVFIDDVENK
ncbi:putative NTPase-like protein [Seal parapoxvirus]|uniref:Putative NTPase-like protein n=1 Tax=Seal parapoxvirus TaxID=187984 RepID=A0A1Z3GCT5_9POXV|nr:putative NTPase-like protein [Seal parapoxvirus]ASC55572.1 putative NTPase-like protein [Seal parapoxvirus]